MIRTRSFSFFLVPSRIFSKLDLALKFSREASGGTIGEEKETEERGEKSTANRKADHNERLHHAGDRSHFGTRRTSFFFARSFWPTCDDGSELADTPPLKDNNRGSRYLEESTEKLERSTPFLVRFLSADVCCCNSRIALRVSPIIPQRDIIFIILSSLLISYLLDISRFLIIFLSSFLNIYVEHKYFIDFSSSIL